eukprot:COSAG06_NODE_54062_length_296_cov_1.314721_1_plen_26_part_10
MHANAAEPRDSLWKGGVIAVLFSFAV